MLARCVARRCPYSRDLMLISPLCDCPSQSSLLGTQQHGQTRRCATTSAARVAAARVLRAAVRRVGDRRANVPAFAALDSRAPRVATATGELRDHCTAADGCAVRLSPTSTTQWRCGLPRRGVRSARSVSASWLFTALCDLRACSPCCPADSSPVARVMVAGSVLSSLRAPAAL